MKKIVLATFTVICLVFNANSQTLEQKAEEDFRPSAGDVSLEVNLLSPFVVGQPIYINYLRGRYFLSDNMAIRKGLEFNIISSKDKGDDWEYSGRVIDFGFYPGIEKHFTVGKRVSPYLGKELGIFNRSTYEYAENEADYEVKNEDGLFSFHLNLVGGVDIYIYKGLYLGAELGYGFERVSFKDTEITTNGSESTIENNEVIFRLGDNVNTAIRLGWVF